MTCGGSGDGTYELWILQGAPILDTPSELAWVELSKIDQGIGIYLRDGRKPSSRNEASLKIFGDSDVFF